MALSLNVRWSYHTPETGTGVDALRVVAPRSRHLSVFAIKIAFPPLPVLSFGAQTVPTSDPSVRLERHHA